MARVASLPVLALAAVLGGAVAWLVGPATRGPAADAYLPEPSLATQRHSVTFAPIGEPTAVGVLPGGDLLVAEVSPPAVRRFAPDGRLRALFDNTGLQYPTALTTADDGRAWVSDLWAGTVYAVDPLTGALSEVPANMAGYVAPGALAYGDGRLYVADLQLQQILVLDASDGRLLRTLGRGGGSEPGQLAYPNGILASAGGEVFVADTNNQRIQVFDAASGRVARVLQPAGVYNPRGIAQDARGLLHVVDSVSGDVVVLEPRAGEVLARYGVQAQMRAPMGVAVSGRRVYVADRGNGRVVGWDL